MSAAYDSPPPDNAVSIDWNGDVFVLTVRTGATAPPIAYGTSRNGTDWTYTSPSALAASTGAAAADLYNVQWLGGRRFVVCGNVAVTATTSAAAPAQLPAIFQLQGPEYTPVARYVQPTAGASVPQTVYEVADALEHPHRIVFPASTLLALGNNGARIAVSGDEGATWTASSNGAAVFSVAAHDAAWNGRVFVAVGDDSNGGPNAPGNLIASSLDGRRWTTRGGRHLFRTAYAVQWCKERDHFLALGDDPAASVSVVATSMDGVHWREVHRGLFAAGTRMDLGWNGELWVATGAPRPNVAGSKSLAFSVDGNAWSYISGEDPFPNTGGGSRVFYLADDRQWVALDASAAHVALSMNGRQWQQAQPVANAAWGVASPSFELPFPLLSDPSWIAQPTRYVFNDCTQGRATIRPLSLAGGEGTATGTAVAYSVDGTVWSPAAAPCPLQTCNRICWNGRLWVGVGTPCVAASLDGIRWFAVSSTELFTETYDVAWNGQWFVAVGYKVDASANVAQPQIARSRDGLDWTTAVNAGVAATFAGTDRVAAIEWTGRAWVAYGSQSVSAVSTDADASTWTRKHYYLLDASNVAQPALGAVATASSINGDTATVLGAGIVMDGSDSTFWESDFQTYGPSGEYIGNQQTAYLLPGGDPEPLTVSGEWLQIDLSAAAVVRHYCLSISDNDWPFVPKTWVLLASANRGNTWTFVDSFALSLPLSLPPLNGQVGPSTPYTVWALDVSNAAAYHSFRLVFPTSMGPAHDTVKLSEWKLIVENSGVVVDAPYRIRPLVLKDYVLHPIRLQNDTRNICSVTDLCGNFVRDGVVYGQYYVDAVVHGLAQGAACAHAYDGYYHVAASTAGELAFMTNGSSLNNLRWTPLLEDVAPVCPLTSVRSACFNTRFVLLAGDNGGGVVYGAFGLDKQYPAEFYPTNAASVVGGNVRCVASNSGFGHVVPHNTLYIERGEHLAVTTPAHYADSSTEKTQISFVAQPR